MNTLITLGVPVWVIILLIVLACFGVLLIIVSLAPKQPIQPEDSPWAESVPFQCQHHMIQSCPYVDTLNMTKDISCHECPLLLKE